MGCQSNSANENQKHILKLEKKYFEEIKKIFSSEDFKNDLKRIEKNIQDDYKVLSEHWQVANKVKTVVERLVRHHMYKNIPPVEVYHSPLSSDLAYYVEDAVLNVDAKTINNITNSTDANRPACEKNQISFLNNPKFGNEEYVGVRYRPVLPSKDRFKSLPLLTYFIKIIYSDDVKKSTFKINRIDIYCVPNGELSNLFDNDIIEGFKTYDYVSNDLSKTLEKGYEPLDDTNDDWIATRFGERGTGTYYIDNSINNPMFNEDTSCCWGKENKKYRVIIRGGAARLVKSALENRYDEQGMPWSGYYEVSLEK